MTDTPSFLAERLRVEGGKTIAYFNALDEEKWNKSVYTENSIWTVRNILVHFVTAEQGFIQLFKDVIAGGKGAREDFNIDRFNASQQVKMQDASPRDLVVLFSNVRTEMIALVSSLTQDELSLQGRHPFLGPTTLCEMIRMVYRHNQIHHRDLRKTIVE
jgi:uncharacterized damage-inducible protein DinB